MCTKTHDNMVYPSWDMGATTQFSVVLGHFLIWVIWAIWVIFSLLAPKIKTWKKIRRYFIFHMCKINKDSWHIRHYRQKFFVILNQFLLFYPTNKPRNQNFEIMKKNPGDMVVLHLCTTMMYGSWDMDLNKINIF